MRRSAPCLSVFRLSLLLSLLLILTLGFTRSRDNVHDEIAVAAFLIVSPRPS